MSRTIFRACCLTDSRLPSKDLKILRRKRVFCQCGFSTRMSSVAWDTAMKLVRTWWWKSTCRTEPCPRLSMVWFLSIVVAALTILSILHPLQKYIPMFKTKLQLSVCMTQKRKDNMSICMKRWFKLCRTIRKIGLVFNPHGNSGGSKGRCLSALQSCYPYGFEAI